MTRSRGTKPRVLISDELVLGAVGGDEAARDELVSVCLPRIWRTVHLTCGATQDAEDLVQTAMVNALEKIGTYRGPGRFHAWLDTLTVNVVRMHFRRKRPWLLFGGDEDQERLASEPWVSPDRKLETKRIWGRLLTHFSRIKQKNRIAMVLAVFHGYRASDIAEMVGCSTETAQKRSRRGFLELEKLLDADPGLKQAIKELVQ